jgi:hypothetical protein
MPFKSEKQRRFLWLKHPDIAKRWAKEYPNQKKLPMYADDSTSDSKKEEETKVAALNVLQSVLINSLKSHVTPVVSSTYDDSVKQSNSKQEYITIPHGGKPTYAGEEHVTEMPKPDTEDEGHVGTDGVKGLDVSPLFNKISVVLAPRIQQMIENERAQQEARVANRMPNNVNVKRYPVSGPVIPPPMGMTQAPPQAAQPQQPQQPQPAQAQQTMPTVGGGKSPQANPINAFGGLSSSGDINGNAALGTQNSMGGEKLSAQKCSCGCGDTVNTCKCPASCKCKQPGGSCYKAEKTSASSPAWQRSAGKNDEGGLNAKGRASYNRETGGHLKAPVTESKPSGDRAKRQNSFCSRMCGMKSVNTGADTAKDPDSRINKALRKWNCKCSSALEFGEKIAIDIERGGLPSRVLASTIGHVGGGLSGLPIMSLKNHENPTDWEGASGSILDHQINPEDERAQNLKHIAEAMEKVNPQELGGHRVVLGGTRIDRDIPRIFTNPRTSVLGKALGVATYPLNALMGNLFRGSHYNPFTDTSHVYGNSPAVLSHELGHALDFNSTPVPGYSAGENPVKTWFKRQGHGLVRDGYMLSRGLSPIMLKQEAQANLLSEKNLRKALEKDPRLLNEVFDDRQRELPVGMGSYVGAAASPFLGPAGGIAPLAGMFAGRAYGQAEADRMKGRWARVPKQKNKKEEHKEEDSGPVIHKFKPRKEEDDKDEKQEPEKSRRKAAAAPPLPYRLPANKLREMFNSQASQYAPTDPAMQDKARFFADALLKHRKTPELSMDVGALPRSTLPADVATDKEMKTLGFLPSYVAVPERGQTQLRTWRHPYTGMHLHRHGQRWIFHEDNWPSFSMQMAKFKKENPGVSLPAAANFGAKTFLTDSLPHVMYEGVPGYVNYTYNTVMGNPTFSSILDHTEKQKTVPDQLGRGLAASVALGALYSGLGRNPEKFYSGTGAGLGFLGGNVLSKHVQNFAQQYNPNLRNPGPGSLALTAGIPLATAFAGSALGKRLYGAVQQVRKKDKQRKKLAPADNGRDQYAYA